MTPEEKNKYFEEMKIRLRQQGLGTLPANEDGLPVEVGGMKICIVTPNGGVRYEPTVITKAEEDLIERRITGAARTVKEYMALMETAPRLKASSLDSDYRVLAEFNNVVLAGHSTRFGVQFATWEWVQDHTSLWQGHYTDSYSAVKADFATRAGLLPKERVFIEEQLAEIYRCVHETLDSGYPLTRGREKILSGITAQIEQAVPDLDELVQKSNERELNQGQAEYPGMNQQF